MNFAITASYTDLYQIAMGQAFFLNGERDWHATFDYFFRKAPNAGGYTVFAGLAGALELLHDLHFSAEDIDYLASLGFDARYLKHLGQLRFRGTVHGVREGDVIFPTEPVLRVSGNIIQVQLVETLLLNVLNFQSLIATKAARIRSVAGNAILSEFGLRRAPGLGGVWGSRAAVVGGFDSTSNVYAARRYGLKAEGTMAHSFIQLHEDELTAFRKFIEANPDRATLLVDTYDTLGSGMPNAIIVGHEMAARGQRLRAIRLDSGDLTFLSRRARAMLDDAGLNEVKIAASNQLDEYIVRSLLQQGAPIDIFGVGTSLATGQPDAALDGVYKLAATGDAPRIKISENVTKITLPGIKQVWRMFDSDGKFHGADVVGMANEAQPARMIDPFDDEKKLDLSSLRGEAQLQLLMINGEAVQPLAGVAEAARYCRERLALLPDEYKRLEYPHQYKVGISDTLHDLRNALRRRYAMGKTA
ncbi:MAG: nicotinate phosphoribosyltransferase [Burkholderiales bacterium]